MEESVEEDSRINIFEMSIRNPSEDEKIDK